MKRKFFSIKRKDLRLGIILGLIVGVSGILLAFCFSYFFLVGIIDFGQGDLLNPFLDEKIGKAYENVAVSWQENEFVQSLSYICSFQDTELKKVKCVHHYIGGIFNYSDHGIGNELRDSPEEIILNGGICRDYSVMFFSIYEKMDFECNFIHKPNHVYINVTCEDCDFYCDVDMGCLNCVEK